MGLPLGPCFNSGSEFSNVYMCLDQVRVDIDRAFECNSQNIYIGRGNCCE